MSTAHSNLQPRRDAQVEYLASQKAKCFQGLAVPVAGACPPDEARGGPSLSHPAPRVRRAPAQSLQSRGSRGARVPLASPTPHTESPGSGGGFRVSAATRLTTSARRPRAPPAPCAPPHSSERGPAARTRVSSGRCACALWRGRGVPAPVPAHLDVPANTLLGRCPPTPLLGWRSRVLFKCREVTARKHGIKGVSV